MSSTFFLSKIQVFGPISLRQHWAPDTSFKISKYIVCVRVSVFALDDVQNNLNMVHFQIGVPTADVLDMIYTYLPDIEFQIFGSDGVKNTVKLDLTPSKSLKRSYFILQQGFIRYRLASINFEYQDRKEQCYFYDSKSRVFSRSG